MAERGLNKVDRQDYPVRGVRLQRHHPQHVELIALDTLSATSIYHPYRW